MHFTHLIFFSSSSISFFLRPINMKTQENIIDSQKFDLINGQTLVMDQINHKLVQNEIMSEMIRRM